MVVLEIRTRAALEIEQKKGVKIESLLTSYVFMNIIQTINDITFCLSFIIILTLNSFHFIFIKESTNFFMSCVFNNIFIECICISYFLHLLHQLKNTFLILIHFPLNSSFLVTITFLLTG